jgi:hypothetical protein
MEKSEKFSIFCHRKSGVKLTPYEGMQVMKQLLECLQKELPELFVNDTLNVQTFSKNHRVWIKNDLSDYDILMAPVLKRLVQKDYKARNLDYNPKVKSPKGFAQGFVNYWGKEHLDDRVSLRVTQGFESGFVNNTIHIKFNPYFYTRLSNLEHIQSLFSFLIDFWEPEQLFIAPFSLRKFLGETDPDLDTALPSIGWVTWFPGEPDILNACKDFIIKPLGAGTLIALSETAEFEISKEKVDALRRLKASLCI